MSISIALTTFNGERFLRRQLASLADQTVSPSELVVSDDKSRDDTLRILFRFAKTAPFPVHISQPKSRLGYRRNFMRVAKLCKSELIAFCDQDDIWEPNKLQIMQREFADPRVLLAFHGASLINKSETKMGRIHARRKDKIHYKPLALPPNMIIPGFSQVVRSSLVRFTRLHRISADPYHPDQRMPHDLWYPFWASVLGHTVHVPAPLVRYRQHGENASGWIKHWSAAYIAHQVRNAEFYARSNAVSIASRLQLLQRSQKLAAGDEADRIKAAIEHYNTLAHRHDQRWGLYTTKRWSGRVRTLASLIRSGVYTDGKCDSLGLDALLLDTFIGVPFARIYRRR
jgi:glycosyltransferase involved in cell wall biosynthesis